MATLHGKKLKKRLKVKYVNWWGCMIRKRDTPVNCYNKNCIHHSVYCYDDCLESKCRFKNNRFKPSEENENWWDKQF